MKDVDSEWIRSRRSDIGHMTCCNNNNTMWGLMVPPHKGSVRLYRQCTRPIVYVYMRQVWRMTDYLMRLQWDSIDQSIKDQSIEFSRTLTSFNFKSLARKHKDWIVWTLSKSSGPATLPPSGRLWRSPYLMRTKLNRKLQTRVDQQIGTVWSLPPDSTCAHTKDENGQRTNRQGTQSSNRECNNFHPKHAMASDSKWLIEASTETKHDDFHRIHSPYTSNASNST